MDIPTTSLNFSVISKNDAPEVPLAKGNKESPLSSSLKELPRGGFIHIPSIDAITRKRVSDMCSRLKRLSGGERVFVLRKITFHGVSGLGIWRADGDPIAAPKARVVGGMARSVTSVERIPPPTKEQLMGRK